MLKKLTILFVLINYLNTSVFFPEVVLVSSSITQSEDEINSIFEFLTDKCMDTPDDTPEDEDDDIPDGGKFGEKIDEKAHHCLAIFSYPFLNNAEGRCKHISFYQFFTTNHFLNNLYQPPELKS